MKRTGGHGVFHLSTAMCPAHRTEVLNEVRRRLEAGERCLVVSTQLIEAGVDVDFPLVFRELAPLEAIIQAAGRCNRKGKLAGAGGTVVVFRSLASTGEHARRYYPADRWYIAGRDVLEQQFLNAGRSPRIDAPEDIREYYDFFYHRGGLDAEGIQDARRRWDFPTVSDAYRLIDDGGFAAVVASWKEHSRAIEELLKAFDGPRTGRAAYRKLAPYQINIRGTPEATPGIVEEHPGVYVWRGTYDPEAGFELGDDPGRYVI